jgi:hypothetical protein
MTLPPASSDRTLNIYLSLAQYPILSTQIRARMRRELFRRGVIAPLAFEAEVREKAIRSQALEGLHNPFAEEPTDIWEMRLMRVRDHLTDFYFAYNLPYDLFERIVRETLLERRTCRFPSTPNSPLRICSSSKLCRSSACQSPSEPRRKPACRKSRLS